MADGQGEQDWVALTTRFTPGWPWPEDSYGLDPMFGLDGWCRACGTPLREQIGPLTIKGRKFPTSNVWMPNWHFDVVCVSADVAPQVAADFSVSLRDVHKPHEGASGAKQILPLRGSVNWYEPALLREAVIARHSGLSGRQTGATCQACGQWRWLPIIEGEVPIARSAIPAGSDVVASREIFGDGWKTFRHLLFRLPLAELLVAANPRSWSIVEVALTPG